MYLFRRFLYYTFENLRETRNNNLTSKCGKTIFICIRIRAKLNYKPKLSHPASKFNNRNVNLETIIKIPRAQPIMRRSSKINASHMLS